MIIWIIGLSGSGKTTLGRCLADTWRLANPNTVFLDGDEVRDVFKFDQGVLPYTIHGRRQNSDRLVALCELLDRQGINVVCCILSIFPEVRAANRMRFSKYFEVFMDAPLDILKQRDVKGLYAMAEAGELMNVVGLDIPFDRPDTPDLIIDSSGDNPDLSSLVSKVMESAGLVENDPK